MNAYEHFGLSTPPFETLPEPGFFYNAPQHEEALATLQYTVHANKGCCALLGDSGAGKTLIARLLCRSIDPQTAVLWIHGFDQNGKILKVNVYAPGSFAEADVTPGAEQTTLNAWARTRTANAHGHLLIIDNADELPAKTWRGIISLLTAETSDVRPPNIALFGLPRLIQTLGKPELVRLRRRIFRTYVLGAFAYEQVCEYVQFRLTTAGANANNVFSEDALMQVYRLTRGNPGLINQVCDNALINAYGEERHRVEAEDILTAIHTIVGGRLSIRGAPNTLVWAGTGAPALPAPVRAHPLADADPDAQQIPTPRPDGTPVALPVVLARASRRVVATVLEDAPEAHGPNVVRRLRNLEGRLAHALSAVREARLLRSEVVGPGGMTTIDPDRTAQDAQDTLQPDPCADPTNT